MIYEVRTYRLKPGTVAECEQRFAEALPYREQYSPLGAFWHTEIGPLNQIIHVWPYEDVQQRATIRARAAQDPHWPPTISHLVETIETEIFLPAPFMPPLGKRQRGGIYEMRTYLYQPGTIPEVLARWAAAIPQRVQLSPLAACWYSEVGELNTFVHIWPYRDLAERDRIRAAAQRLPSWPPKTREFLLRQSTKILIPAAFSPLQ